jgi:hypothetical protein
MTKASGLPNEFYSQNKSEKKGLENLILEWGAPHSSEQLLIDALNEFDDGLASALDLDKYPQHVKASNDPYTQFFVADFFP